MLSKNLTWQDYSDTPLINPPFPDWILADPSVLTPSESPDKTWHMFVHGMFGLYHYTSKTGLVWKKQSKTIVRMGFRPWIYNENKKYYLIYEKINVLGKTPFRVNFPYYNSHLEIITSEDLINWDKPKVMVRPTLSWHKTPPSNGNIGNPCLIKIGNKYRLYYSAGLIYLPDCRFCEPRYLGVAESKNIFGPYKFISKPLHTGDNDKYTNISASANRVYHPERAMKVYSHNNGYIGLQTCIFKNPKTRKSTASIRFTRSQDGLHWESISGPIVKPDKEWKRSHVYVGDLKSFGNELRIYYNARNGWVWGREAVGLSVAKIK